MVDLAQNIEPAMVTAEPSAASVGTGAAFSHQQVSSIGPGLAALGDGLDALSVSLAKQEAATDVSAAVSRGPDGQLQVDPRPTPFMLGNAARAYQQASEAGLVAATDGVITRQMAELRAAHLNDPQGFAQASAALADNLRTKYSGPLGAQAFQTASRVADQHYSSMVASKAANDVSLAQSSIEGQVSDQISSMNALARQGGTDTPEFQRASGKLDAYYDQLSKNPAFTNWNADRVAQEKARAYDEIHTQAVIGQVDHWKEQGVSADEMRARVRSQIEDNPNLKLSDGQRKGLSAYANARIDYQTDEARNNQAANRLAVNGMVDSYLNGKGNAPDDVTFDKIRQQTIQTGDPTATHMLDIARETYLRNKPYAQQPPAQQSAAIMGTGLGAINYTYNGSLTQATNPNAPAPKQIYDYLVGKGANPNEALMLTGAAASESGLNPKVTHDGGIGYGLFGHNGDRLASMIQMSGTVAPNWQQQADFALKELRTRPESAAVNSAKNVQDLTNAQMAYEAPQGYKPGSPETGHNYTGRFNTLNRFAELSGMQPSAVPTIGQPPTGAHNPIPFTANDIQANAFRVSYALRAFDADQSVQRQITTGLHNSLQAAVTAGIVPQPEMVAAYTQQVARFPQDIGLQQSAQTLTGQIKGMSTGNAITNAQGGMAAGAQVVEAARSIAAQNPNMTNIAFAEGLKKSVTANQKAMDEDPRAYASRPDVGWLPQRQPAPDLGSEIAQRRLEAQKIGTMSGKDPNGLLFGKDDIGQMTQAMSSPDPRQSSHLLGVLTNGLRPQEMAALVGNDDFRAGVSGMLNSGDPQKTGAAAMFMKQQFQSNPVMFKDKYGADAVAKMNAYVNVAAQKTPEQAAKFLNSWDDPSQQRSRDLLQEAANKDLAQVDGHAVVKKLFGNWIMPNPGDPTPLESGSATALQGDYADAYKRALVFNGGAKDAAQKDAEEWVKKTWAPSDINGGVVMRHAPEQHYPLGPDGSLDYFKTQLVSEVQSFSKANGIEPANPGFLEVNWKTGDVGLSRQPFRLLSDAGTETDIARGKAPSYGIAVQDKTGRWQVLHENDGVTMHRFYATPPNLSSQIPAMQEMRNRVNSFTPPAYDAMGG